VLLTFEPGQNLRLRYVLLDDPAAFAAAGSAGFLPGDHADARAARAAVVAKNIRDLHVRGIAVRWPTYPLADGWHLLDSPNRLGNRPFYDGAAEAVRNGRKRCVFRVLWGRKLQGGRIDLDGLRSSDGSPLADLDAASEANVEER